MACFCPQYAESPFIPSYRHQPHHHHYQRTMYSVCMYECMSSSVTGLQNLNSGSSSLGRVMTPHHMRRFEIGNGWKWNTSWAQMQPSSRLKFFFHVLQHPGSEERQIRKHADPVDNTVHWNRLNRRPWSGSMARPTSGCGAWTINPEGAGQSQG